MPSRSEVGRLAAPKSALKTPTGPLRRTGAAMRCTVAESGPPEESRPAGAGARGAGCGGSSRDAQPEAGPGGRRGREGGRRREGGGERDSRQSRRQMRPPREASAHGLALGGHPRLSTGGGTAATRRPHAGRRPGGRPSSAPRRLHTRRAACAPRRTTRPAPRHSRRPSRRAPSLASARASARSGRRGGCRSWASRSARGHTAPSAASCACPSSPAAFRASPRRRQSAC